MEAKKKPAKNDKPKRNINDFAVGDHVKVNMHRGRIVDATIKAVIERTPSIVSTLALIVVCSILSPWKAYRQNTLPH